MEQETEKGAAILVPAKRMEQFQIAVANCCQDPRLETAGFRGLEGIRNTTENPVEFTETIEEFYKENPGDGGFRLTGAQFSDLRKLHRFARGTKDAQIQRSSWAPPDLDPSRAVPSDGLLQAPGSK